MTKVLVVDDEEAIRFTFKKFLTDAGHLVWLAAHETDAKNILASTRFDVAVVDHILSDTNGGAQILKNIKKLQPLCQVIMMSGSPSFNIKSEITESDYYASLAKPIRKDVLCRMVAEAAEKRTCSLSVSTQPYTFNYSKT